MNIVHKNGLWKRFSIVIVVSLIFSSMNFGGLFTYGSIVHASSYGNDVEIEIDDMDYIPLNGSSTAVVHVNPIWLTDKLTFGFTGDFGNYITISNPVTVSPGLINLTLTCGASCPYVRGVLRVYAYGVQVGYKAVYVTGESFHPYYDDSASFDIETDDNTSLSVGETITITVKQDVYSGYYGDYVIMKDGIIDIVDVKKSKAYYGDVFTIRGVSVGQTGILYYDTHNNRMAGAILIDVGQTSSTPVPIVVPSLMPSASPTVSALPSATPSATPYVSPSAKPTLIPYNTPTPTASITPEPTTETTSVVIDGVTYKKTGKGVSVFGKKNKRRVSIKSAVKLGSASYKIKSIASNAFRGFWKLKTIRIEGCDISKIGKNAFDGINEKAVFYLPQKRFSKYKKMISKSGGKRKWKFKNI